MKTLSTYTAYPLENTCGCGVCPDCLRWDRDYSLAEWARVKAEDEAALPEWREEHPSYVPPPAEVLEAGGPISYSQLSDLNENLFPRIEEEDWREADRRKDEEYARDNEPRDPGAWNPISQRYGL